MPTPPRRDVCSGSFSTDLGCPDHVRFPPISDQAADIAGRLKRARLGHRLRGPELDSEWCPFRLAGHHNHQHVSGSDMKNTTERAVSLTIRGRL
jgi:hypothetical protein